MKNLRLLAFAAVAIAFGSCSSDDNSDNNNNNNSGSIEGTYNLTEFNTSTPTDFDEDGTSSTNQVNESECYDDVQLTLRADNTFTYDIGYITVNNADGSDTCTDYTVNGTWRATNSTITVTYEYNGSTETVNFARSNEGKRLTETRALTTFPNRNGDGAAINTVGSVQLVFEK